MTDPPEPLGDPTRERLLDHPADRPPAEFSPHIRALIWVAAIVGLVVSVCVFVMVIVWRMALP
jgi:hypothetical protein